MGQETNISWTDHSFNPWWGCTAVSEGCDHCYAEAFDKRVGGAHWGKGVPRRTFKDEHWNEPLKWNREAEVEGIHRKVFCASMADVMDDEAPMGHRERLWHLIDSTPWLTWQLLTKRPQRYLRYLPHAFIHNNVWLGCTTENQPNYDLRISHLSAAAALKGLTCFVSYEPAIGPLSLMGKMKPDWLICGGESGGGRRPMETSWAENIKVECSEYEVKFFMKQMSAITPTKGAALIPVSLLLREFPA